MNLQTEFIAQQYKRIFFFFTSFDNTVKIEMPAGVQQHATALTHYL